jgi:endonuclease III
VKDEDIHEVMALLTRASGEWVSPAVTIVSQREGDPFKVLISCILSLRTHDRTTGPASERIFVLAPDAATLAELSLEQVEQAIYPVGFFRNKAAQIIAIARRLRDDYAGIVPDSLDELLTFNGVGRKTANLVVTLGYGTPGICVDTHVHRICNRLGYVTTMSPDKTEMVLREKLPPRYWIGINDLLVMCGQNLCVPVSPRCSICPVIGFCPRNGVTKSR